MNEYDRKTLINLIRGLLISFNRTPTNEKVAVWVNALQGYDINLLRKKINEVRMEDDIPSIGLFIKCLKPVDNFKRVAPPERSSYNISIECMNTCIAGYMEYVNKSRAHLNKIKRERYGSQYDKPLMTIEEARVEMQDCMPITLREVG
jgi:hypothetical protein